MSLFPHARHKGRIGIILPSSNTNIEPDCVLLAPSEVSIHFTRVGGYDVDSIPDLEVQRNFALQSLEETLALLSDASVDVMAYGCTSATAPSGPAFDKQFQEKMAHYTGKPSVTTAGAIIEALNVLKIKKVAFTSPYVAEVNKEMIQFISDYGFEVVSQADAKEAYSSRDFIRLTPEDAYRLAKEADHPDAEVVIISCTDFRALEVLEVLETELGKPVITSNQALMYACLTRLGIDTTSIKLGGQLFSRLAHK